MMKGRMNAVKVTVSFRISREVWERASYVLDRIGMKKSAYIENLLREDSLIKNYPIKSE